MSSIAAHTGNMFDMDQRLDKSIGNTDIAKTLDFLKDAMGSKASYAMVETLNTRMADFGSSVILLERSLSELQQNEQRGYDADSFSEDGARYDDGIRWG